MEDWGIFLAIVVVGAGIVWELIDIEFVLRDIRDVLREESDEVTK